MRVFKGNIVHDRFGNTFEVLATRKNKYCSRQDLLLKNKKTKAIVVVTKWRPESVSNPSYGGWSSGNYYGVCDLRLTNYIKNNFKKGW